MSGYDPFELLDDPDELARHGGWTAAVYKDMLALKSGELSREDFRRQHHRTRAILVQDMTGFTRSTHAGDALGSFLRILNVRQICVPIMKGHGARFIRCFADDIVVIFDDPNVALDAALEAQSRVQAFNASTRDNHRDSEICIGLGFGEVFAIGPNKAMGDEMNKASKLGEDMARGGEILATHSLAEAVQGRDGLTFTAQTHEDVPFPFYKLKYLATSAD